MGDPSKYHGTMTGYAYGCRCDGCRDAKNAYQRVYRKEYDRRPYVVEKRKAYRREYTKRDDIKEKSRERHRQVRYAARNGERVVPSHGASGFINFGCQCDVCREAWAGVHRAYMDRHPEQREKARERERARRAARRAA